MIEARSSRRTDAVIVGASFDTPAANKAVRGRGGLPVPAAVGPGPVRRPGLRRREGPDEQYADFPRRRSFLIDPDGVVRRIYDVTDTAAIRKQVLDDLDRRWAADLRSSHDEQPPPPAARRSIPSRYDLVLEPDLEAGQLHRHGGRRRLVVDEATDELVCNAAELDPHRGGGRRRRRPRRPCHGRSTTSTSGSRSRCPRRCPPGRRPASRSTFTGTLNDKLRGWYRSTFKDDDGVERVIATSQMQATDCRRAFPCWDEPDFKAVFGVTLVVAEDLLAISNGPEVAARPRRRPARRVRFADTMAMSTYLVAFIVGPLEATAPVDVDGVPMRVVHVPGKATSPASALEVGAFALRWFQRLLRHPLPVGQGRPRRAPRLRRRRHGEPGLHHVPGERSSWSTRRPPRRPRSSCVADVVAHELAHMWFGDLVTMRWWNGIWLNEAFATFMEVAACDAFRPAWKRWETFSARAHRGLRDRLPDHAPARWSSRSCRPTTPTACSTSSPTRRAARCSACSSSTSARSASGTASATTWPSTATATPRPPTSGTRSRPPPASRCGASWTAGSGRGATRSSRAALDRRRPTLVLRQRRFLFDEDDADAATVGEHPVGHPGQRAPGRPAGRRRLGTVVAPRRSRRCCSTSDELRLPLVSPDAVVVVNSGGHGFYRVAYDDALRARLAGGGAARAVDRRAVRAWSTTPGPRSSPARPRGRPPSAQLAAGLRRRARRRRLADARRRPRLVRPPARRRRRGSGSGPSCASWSGPRLAGARLAAAPTARTT